MVSALLFIAMLSAIEQSQHGSVQLMLPSDEMSDADEEVTTISDSGGGVSGAGETRLRT